MFIQGAIIFFLSGWLFSSLTSAVTSESKQKPTHWCRMDPAKTCVFLNVELTKNQSSFQPAATSPLNVTAIKFLNSTVPVFTKDICNAFPSLKEIEAYGVHLEEIQENALHNCSHLRYIDFRINKLQGFHKDTFKYTKNLESLNLQVNRIRDLELGLFNSMPLLRSLDVGNNNLTEFDSELIKQNKKLEDLQLFSNDISHLDYEKLLEYLPKLKQVGYNNNELSCKKVEVMNKEIRKRGIHLIYLDAKIKRYYPEERVDDIKCAPDISWSAADYRKQREVNMDEKIKSLEAYVQSANKEMKMEIAELKAMIKVLIARK